MVFRCLQNEMSFLKARKSNSSCVKQRSVCVCILYACVWVSKRKRERSGGRDQLTWKTEMNMVRPNSHALVSRKIPFTSSNSLSVNPERQRQWKTIFSFTFPCVLHKNSIGWKTRIYFVRPKQQYWIKLCMYRYVICTDLDFSSAPWPVQKSATAWALQYVLGNR